MLCSGKKACNKLIVLGIAHIFSWQFFLNSPGGSAASLSQLAAQGLYWHIKVGSQHTVCDVPSQTHIGFSRDLWFFPQWARSRHQVSHRKQWGGTRSVCSWQHYSWLAFSMLLVGFECRGSFWICYGSSLTASFAVITASTLRFSLSLWAT